MDKIFDADWIHLGAATPELFNADFVHAGRTWRAWVSGDLYGTYTAKVECNQLGGTTYPSGAHLPGLRSASVARNACRELVLLWCRLVEGLREARTKKSS